VLLLQSARGLQPVIVRRLLELPLFAPAERPLEPSLKRDERPIRRPLRPGAASPGAQRPLREAAGGGGLLEGQAGGNLFG
jgi:hypothetical protein